MVGGQQDFGAWLREQRELRDGLSQARLAEMVGVSKRTIERWEAKPVSPHRANVERLERALGEVPPRTRTELTEVKEALALVIGVVGASQAGLEAAAAKVAAGDSRPILVRLQELLDGATEMVDTVRSLEDRLGQLESQPLPGRSQPKRKSL